MRSFALWPTNKPDQSRLRSCSTTHYSVLAMMHCTRAADQPLGKWMCVPTASRSNSPALACAGISKSSVQLPALPPLSLVRRARFARSSFIVPPRPSLPWRAGRRRADKGDGGHPPAHAVAGDGGGGSGSSGKGRASVTALTDGDAEVANGTAAADEGASTWVRPDKAARRRAGERARAGSAASRVRRQGGTDAMRKADAEGTKQYGWAARGRGEGDGERLREDHRAKEARCGNVKARTCEWRRVIEALSEHSNTRRVHRAYLSLSVSARYPADKCGEA